MASLCFFLVFIVFCSLWITDAQNLTTITPQPLPASQTYTGELFFYISVLLQVRAKNSVGYGLFSPRHEFLAAYTG